MLLSMHLKEGKHTYEELDKKGVKVGGGAKFVKVGAKIFVAQIFRSLRSQFLVLFLKNSRS